MVWAFWWGIAGKSFLFCAMDISGKMGYAFGSPFVLFCLRGSDTGYKRGMG